MSSSTHATSHSDTLPHKDILSKPGGIFSDPKDILPLHENALPHLVDSQPEDSQPEDSQPEDSTKPADSTMPGSNRSEGRNVHIFDSRNPSTKVGGLILTNGVTNTNLYAMIEIIVIFEGGFSLRNESGVTIAKDNDQLQPGNYYISADRKFLSNSLIDK
jgi:hypothetical protein